MVLSASLSVSDLNLEKWSTKRDDICINIIEPHRDLIINLLYCSGHLLLFVS